MKSLFLLILTFSFFNLSIDKGSFYDALSSNSVEDLEQMIQLLEKEKATPLNLAYKGTLIAKKAGHAKNAAEKVKLFKSGIKLLEAEILRSPKEIEYRFLRLTIQENCPKILKYNQNIEEDVTMITKGFSHLNKELKHILLDYSKNSKLLKSSDLK